MNYVNSVDLAAVVGEEPQEFHVSFSCGRMERRFHADAVRGFDLEVTVVAQQFAADVNVTRLEGHVQREVSFLFHYLLTDLLFQ